MTNDANNTGHTVDLHVPIVARVEGEGALHLRIRQGVIEELHLRIYEPPRLFEKFLEGRSYEEVPDLVARICGICPVAYQISAVNALENLLEIDPGPWVQAMRRVLYCGEWIQSHSLHVHLLAAPDFFGYESAIAMAADYPDIVRRGMRLQSLGNALIRLLGGRSVHPVGVRVGGFHRAPPLADVIPLLAELERGLQDAHDLVLWAASIPVPQRASDVVQLSLLQAEHYPMSGGERIIGTAGLDIPLSAVESHIHEYQVPYSTALFSRLTLQPNANPASGQPFLVGPLARLNLQRQQLPASTQTLLAQTGIIWPSHNMFHSLLARAVEIHAALQIALNALQDYQPSAHPWVPVTPRAGSALGASEAPRGLLWHSYTLDERGIIQQTRIVPPTSQNQAQMEADLHQSLLAFGLDHPEDALRRHCEQVIRNYDPCISCATHFLTLTTERV